MRIVDRDYVELSNLQRQWLFDECDVEQALPKAVAAARKIAAINRDIQVEPVVADLTAANVDELLGDVDLILDGTDNFETRYLINDYAVERGAAVDLWRGGGELRNQHGGCARADRVPAMRLSRSSWRRAADLRDRGRAGSGDGADREPAGERGATGFCAALEPSGKITTADVWTGEIRQVAQPGPVEDCPACGRREFPYLDGARRAPVSLCGHNAVQIHERARPLDLRDLAARLAPLGPVRSNEFALRFETAPYLLTIFPDGRAIIKGTTDVGIARSLYARYVGA